MAADEREQERPWEAMLRGPLQPYKTRALREGELWWSCLDLDRALTDLAAAREREKGLREALEELVKRAEDRDRDDALGARIMLADAVQDANAALAREDGDA